MFSPEINQNLETDNFHSSWNEKLLKVMELSWAKICLKVNYPSH